MEFFRKHIVSICAVLTLVAVGCYEGYWILHMYGTERKSVESIISSSIAGAEVEEYLERIKMGQDTLRLPAKDPSMRPRMVSMSFDSLSGSLNEVNIYKLDKKDFADTYLNSKPDMDKIQELVCAYLDSTGLDVKCRLVFEGDADGIILASDTDSCPNEKMVLAVPSNVNDGQYKVYAIPLARYIAGRMAGVMAISAGILLIIALAFIMMDMTIRKRRRLDEMKNDFTRNITHELKTPIAVAYAANDTLLEYRLGDNPVKRGEYLRIIKDQLDKLGGMVEMILSTTMENRSGLMLDYAPTPLGPMLETAASQIRMKAEKPCDIKVSVIPENLEVVLDRKLMSSVILTILDNALKYSGESVSISVEAHVSAGKTVISVSDNGFGIARSDQKHVFDKFYRVPTGNRHDVKGYGLGLFFAKSIVEKHGGRISVSGEPGKGSSFTIEL